MDAKLHRPSDSSEDMKRAPHKQSWLRKLASAVGFQKLYHFWLWFIFSGALFGFLLARSSYLNFSGVFCSANTSKKQLHAGPGECYVYTTFERYHVGIRIHLFAIIIAGFLVLFQFVPAIRHKARLFHRINGYIVVSLVLLSHAGALMIANVAFGGSLSTQMWVGSVVIATTIALLLAYINIKRLQIDQHRAWMLRAWFYLASIVTERFIMPAMTSVLTSVGPWYYAMPCAKIEWILGSSTLLNKLYPTCAAFANGSDLSAHAVVLGSFKGPTATNIAAIFDASFGASLWLALFLHAVGIEIYLHLTPGETARLKRVSYERQLERRFKHPGDAGLTSGSLGDAPYQATLLMHNSTASPPA